MSNRMSSDKYELAKSYLMKHGRRLDQRRFEYYFQNGTKKAILSELLTHQNPDGGFQNMGEGLRDESSPIGTSVAFQLITELNIPLHAPIVQKGIKYIIDTFDTDLGLWQPASNRLHDNDSIVQGWGNPSAELVGYLHYYQDIVPSSFLSEVIVKATNNLLVTERPMDPFVLFCFMRLSEFCSEPHKEMIIQRLKEDVPKVIEIDPNKWSDWCIKPYWFAISPTSPVGDIIEQDVIRNLEFEIQNQSEEGYFPPHWQDNEDNLKTWRSILTIDVLKALRNYKMIDL